MNRRDFIRSLLFIAAATRVPPLVFQKRQDLDDPGSALTPEMLDRAIEYWGRAPEWERHYIVSPSLAAHIGSLI